MSMLFILLMVVGFFTVCAGVGLVKEDGAPSVLLWLGGWILIIIGMYFFLGTAEAVELKKPVSKVVKEVKDSDGINFQVEIKSMVLCDVNSGAGLLITWGKNGNSDQQPVKCVQSL